MDKIDRSLSGAANGAWSWPAGEQGAFITSVTAKLERLRSLLLPGRVGFSGEELRHFMRFWETPVPETSANIFELIFKEFSRLAEDFDLILTQRSLGTSENLALLMQEGGAQVVAERFRRYFSDRLGRQWKVFICPANLEDIHLPPVEVTPGITVELREVDDVEWRKFSEHGIVTERPKGEKVFFVITVDAGDESAAIKKARRAIEQYLAPFYLHAMRLELEKPWYVPRPERIRLLPHELVCPIHDIGGLGVRVDVPRLRASASRLVSPERPPDTEWKSSVQEIVSLWYGKHASSTLDSHLATATRWMYSAEDEESIENSYLKHCIAWEALLPDWKTHASLKRCLWLLVLSLHGQDVWSLQTVSQAERLLDRRNGLAHPRPGIGLRRSLEEDLRILKQALWATLDATLRIRERQRIQGGCTWSWKDTLSRLFDELTSVHNLGKRNTSIGNLVLLATLLLCDEAGNLTELGRAARIESLIVKGRMSWNDPKNSLVWLARAFEASQGAALPHHRLHATLWLRRRQADYPGDFKRDWKSAQTRLGAPTIKDLSDLVEAIREDTGLGPEQIGWCTHTV